LLIFVFSAKFADGQVYDKIEISCDDSLKFQIRITLPEKSYKHIRNSKGSKLSFSNIQLQCNGKDFPVKSMKLHGKTTLYFPKKSFTIKLKDRLCLPGVKDSVCLKEFYLLSLSMDQNYVLNHTAYSLLSSLNIFNLNFNYCEVLINNDTQGIYLIMERPLDYAFKTLNAPVLIRRGFNHEIDNIDINDKNYDVNVKFFRKNYYHMYSLCRKYSGVELYDSLSNYIDLKLYMRWIGFNYLVRNGDYTDELFLYYDTSLNLFKIIPWDYDDLFVLYPHEGGEARRTIHGGQLIFSSEDELDQTIIKDEYLYKMYLNELYFITEQLNDQVLLEIFQKTYCFVYPYYLDNKIIESTQFDKYGLTNKEELYVNIQEKLKALRGMRDMVKQQLKNDFSNMNR